MVLLYIDPGAGSMLIQAMLAAALAIPFFFRTHVGRAIGWLRHRSHDEDNVPSDG